ncbi:MAG: hypothetical protein B0D91_03870 [Oceanospirillales bacterium LUC14_002_19_P2]|nr:MAG: hypothetical protein B0D91_03870 [Oceanospirillales bacterium LUC14_002_19_P2]
MVMRQPFKLRDILKKYSRMFMIGAAGYYQAFYLESLTDAETEMLRNRNQIPSQDDNQKPSDLPSGID